MKTLLTNKYTVFILLIIFSVSCSKDDNGEENGDDLITNDYTGWMDVYFSNTIPPFEASTQLEVS
ncbi:MAG: hypothetical protein PVF73_12590, partial [Bacteroidales bacterium]